MRWWLTAALFAGCVTTPVPVKPVEKPRGVPTPAAVDAQAELRGVVNAFVAASEAGRFDEVLPLLAKPLRDRYSVKVLERDFAADPLAAARVAQLKLKLAGAPSFAEVGESAHFVGKDGRHSRLEVHWASLEWASGRSLRLVHEPEGWRIAALE